MPPIWRPHSQRAGGPSVASADPSLRALGIGKGKDDEALLPVEQRLAVCIGGMPWSMPVTEVSVAEPA